METTTTTTKKNHLDGLPFGFGLEQNGIPSIHKCFGSALFFYFLLYYDTIRAGLIASSNVLFLVFGSLRLYLYLGHV